MPQSEMLKIAISETSCIGKTSLVSYFAERYPDRKKVEIVAEVAREFFEKNSNVKRFSAETQRRIQGIVLQREATVALWFFPSA